MGSKSPSRKVIGAIGEEIAAKYLQSRGFILIDRNYRRPWGEIDIIALKGDVVRFVEVKTQSKDLSKNVSREMFAYRPEEQAHTWKIKKIARTAELYMESSGDKREFQIDVVSVLLDEKVRKARCKLFEQVL